MYPTVERGVNKVPGLGSVSLLSNTEERPGDSRKASGPVQSSLVYLVTVCACVRAESLQSCLILCDPMNCSPPGSSVHRILQVRIL